MLINKSFNETLTYLKRPSSSEKNNNLYFYMVLESKVIFTSTEVSSVKVNNQKEIEFYINSINYSDKSLKERSKEICSLIEGFSLSLANIDLINYSSIDNLELENESLIKQWIKRSALSSLQNSRHNIPMLLSILKDVDGLDEIKMLSGEQILIKGNDIEKYNSETQIDFLNIHIFLKEMFLPMSSLKNKELDFNAFII